MTKPPITNEEYAAEVERTLQSRGVPQDTIDEIKKRILARAVNSG